MNENLNNPGLPDDSLESVLFNLPPEPRETIVQIAREHNIADHDPVWIVVNAIRASDKTFSEAVQQIKTLQAEYQATMLDAIKQISTYNDENAQVLSDAKEIISEVKEMATETTGKLSTNETYCKQMARLAVFMLAGVLIFFAIGNCKIAECAAIVEDISKEKTGMVDAVNKVAQLQRLAGYRNQLTNERATVEADYKELQKAVASTGNMTPQFEALKIDLQQKHDSILKKQRELLQLEKQTYEN